MKSRKGLSYVDWVISLGTFLIAILLIFILIKPQFEPKVGKENLVQNVEDFFYSSTEWSVAETPVIVKRLIDQYDTGSGYEQARVRIWYDSGIAYRMIVPDNSPLETFEGTPIIIHCSAGLCLDEELSITSFPSDPLMNGNYDPPKLICSPDDKILCDATLGTTLVTKGLSWPKFNNLKSKGYAFMKEEMKLPDQVDFEIHAGSEAMFNKMPPSTGNVYVKEREYWWLTDENERTPVKVRIEVW